MTDDTANVPAPPPRDEEPDTEDDRDRAAADDFASLPRKRFWRGDQDRRVAIDPWWLRDDDTPED